MRLDAAITTDTEAGPGPIAGEAAELSIAWLSPDSSSPPFSLSWQDSEQRIVGRDEDCAVCLSGPDVSRRHAVFLRSAPGMELSILDLESRNGTRVNGQTIRTARLVRGDVVRFGGWVGVVAAGLEPFAEIAPGLFGGGAMRRTLAPLQQAAKSDLPIILQGETGTGKEVVARAIHAWSERKGSLVAVNCAALPEGLAEAELFGYRRGAFTGADRASAGLFRSAEGGTLLLDEISDLPLSLQAKILRAIEEREVLPLGESRPVPVDVRVVVAGQESLLTAVKERRFRADLLARLDGMSLRLPPLRERREDTAPLFATLWKALGDGTSPTLEFDFVEQLAVHDWPLNVRELVLLVRRLRVFHAAEKTLRASHLPPRIGERESTADARPAEPASPDPRADGTGAPGERVELPELIVALRASQGNVARASALLGISRQRAYRLIEGYEVDLDAIRK